MLKPLAASILPRLALTFFKFMQPLLIKRITELASDENSESANRNGWGLTAATGLVFIGSAITSAAYQHKANRMVTMVRGSLVGAIYAQTLDLSITSLDESAAVTLMSSDIERICVALQPIHTLWSSPIEIGLAIWLLQKEVGIALLGPLFITAIAMSGPFIISKHMGSAQMIWMGKIQIRVDATAKMLQAMKGIKMLGLSSKISRTIYLLRLEEILKSLRMRKLFVGMIAFGNMSTIFAPGAAFIIYVIVASVNGQTLNVSSAFTALSLITLLVAPIRAIVFAIPPLRAAVGCFDRIETFITSTTRRDHRMLFPRAQGHSSGMLGLDRFFGSTATGPDIELQPITPRMNANSSSAIISVRSLTLSWPSADRPVIADVSFDIQPGHLTMIVGPVASGKSSLLRGLLGEIPSSKGNVYNGLAHAAFVDQTLWIQNCSIRDNIVGVRDFEPEWYASVVQACALDTDIESLSEGDGTNAGSAGSALSGGQKLRIVSYVLFTTYLQLLNLNRHLQELFIRGIKSSS
jgi:ATP-binding cassette subfamily C (CFTR/MRP) protein 1